MVNIVLCHSLKSLWISIYYGYSIEEDENKPKQIYVLDSSTVILKDDKPFKFDLSIMPTDIISCIGKHLEDYPFEIYKDTELYKMFFKLINQMIIKNILNILVI